MGKAVLKIESKTNNVAMIEPYLKEIIEKNHICSERYADILISLTEAVNNAIIHGNDQDESKYVKIHMTEGDQGVIFSVTDEGQGFDPENIPDPTAEHFIECCGGRGVFIIKSLADSVNYQDNGCTVEMRFGQVS
jgi:serine/threonine-protein kinase RsbW